MSYLLHSLGVFVALAAVLGIGAGWISARAKAPPRSSMAVIGAAILAVALLMSASAVVPGRAGLWLDGGLLLVIAYLAGSGLGLVYGRVFGRN